MNEFFKVADSGQVQGSVTKRLQAGEVVTLQVKDEIIVGVDVFVKVIHDTFGSRAAYHLRDSGAHFELMNILFNCSKWPDGIVPSGHFSTDGTFISCVGVNIKQPLRWLFDQAKDLDNPSAGALWTAATAKAFPDLQPAKYPQRFEQDVLEYRWNSATGRRDATVVPPIAYKMALPQTNPSTRLTREPWAQSRSTPPLRSGSNSPLTSRATIRLGSTQRAGEQFKGVPRGWLHLKNRQGQDQIRKTFRNPLDNISVTAIDPGKNHVVAAFNSSPALDYQGGRAEALLYQAGNDWLSLARRSSVSASALVKLFTNEVFSESAPPEPNDDQHRAVREDDIISLNHLHILAKTSDINIENRRRNKLRRQAHLQHYACELARFMLGGKDSPDPGEKAVIGVGNGIYNSFRASTEARMAAPLLRQTEVELKARGVEPLVVVVKEDFTSQRCPDPLCVDYQGYRSETKHAVGYDKVPHFGIAKCERCDGLWSHDGAGAVNIAQMLMGVVRGEERWFK